MSITVTKPFLPPKEEFFKYISDIFDREILTNQGPNVHKLELELSEYLGVNNIHYVTNGTIALQLALEALGIRNGEVITTPFTYVATISSILWQRCTPVFVDIEPENFTIDPKKIEEAITPNTRAIMPVHVFGYACDVDAIQKIANKYNLKVIYDAAHTFGSFYKNKALVSYGDISILSFHATKLFHTIEGGACIVKDKNISEKIDLIKCFGHNSDEYLCLGINAKQDEFNAAMGLANLKYITEIIKVRKENAELYDYFLNEKLIRPNNQNYLSYNYAYYPVVFESEKVLLRVFKELSKENIYPRRYFYPSLNKLKYLDKHCFCPISENISRRIACLPLYYGLNKENIERICYLILKSI